MIYRILMIGLMASTGLIGCAVEEGTSTDKETVADAPFEGDYSTDDKADNWRHPHDGGTVYVGDSVTVDFNRDAGWIGYEIELTAGEVDIDLADDSGSARGDVDTVLIVYGPKRDNDRYPRYPIAINDDVAYNNTNSHILLDVPADGTYRILATTYENWWYYPTNVTTEDATLTIKCPRGLTACGPVRASIGDSCFADGDCPEGAHCDGESVCPAGAACFAPDTPGVCVETRGIGESCFADGECGDGAHCEGEQVCPAGANCFAPDTPGVCVEDYEWVTYAPVQCGGNAWEALPGIPESNLNGELGQIDQHFQDNGIVFQEVGLLTSHMAVCLACSCPRGDLLVAKVTPAEASRLVQEFGFAYSSASQTPFLEQAPIQCGMNPWDESVQPESDGVRSWATKSGVELGYVGFTYPTQPTAVCRACQCSRGDRLVVTPADSSQESGARGLGFGDLYTP